MRRCWLFADQLGPHFLDDDRQRVLLVVSKAVFRRSAAVLKRSRAYYVQNVITNESGNRMPLPIIWR